MRVSLVVPCYNEREGLAALADALEDLRRAIAGRHALEVVFVDDGSTDGTGAALAARFGRTPGVRIVAHAVNRGLGAALRTGIAAATGDVVAMADSDCTFDPRELAPMLDLVAAGADVVVGSPYHPEGGVRGVPAYRRLLSRTLSRLYRHVLGVDLHSFTALFRVYRAEIVRGLGADSDDFLAVTQLLVGVLGRRATIVEYPVTLTVRRHGASKARLLRMIRDHLAFVGGLAGRRLTGRLAVRATVIARPGAPVPLAGGGARYPQGRHE